VRICEQTRSGGNRKHSVCRIQQHIDVTRAIQIALDALAVPRIAVDKQNATAVGIDGLHRPGRLLHGDFLAGKRAGAQLVGKGLETDEALDARHELHVVDRLGEEVVGADFETADAVGRLIERGDHQHRNVLRLLAGLQAAANLEAIHFRHHDVEEDDVDVADVAQVQRFDAGRGRLDLEILRSQPRFEQPYIRRNIVNDQHTRCQRPTALWFLETAWEP
jgi:hypothetical protein